VTPIFVIFSVPEQHLGAIRQRSARQKLAVHVTAPRCSRPKHYGLSIRG
jgi:hypothetical protein